MLSRIHRIRNVTDGRTDLLYHFAR